jgi:ubiquinone/menaquinone biosynthesis C-methylase UbiE
VDLGTGTGRYAIEAAHRGADVTGVDASPAMLSLARSQVELPVTFVQADLAHLPFDDGSFDAAIAVTALCFVAEPEEVLREVARVLRPGGRLVLGELNRWSLWALQRRLEGMARPTIYRQAHFRSIGELHRLLARADLHLADWEGVLHLPPVNNAAFLAALGPLERLGERFTPWLGAFLAVAAARADRRRLA